jgi:hypothetical protein
MNKHVGDSVFKIAPERQKEFSTTLTDFDLIYSNERPWKFCADPKTREIFVSRGAVELIWCASLAHLLFYERLIQGCENCNGILGEFAGETTMSWKRQ